MSLLLSAHALVNAPGTPSERAAVRAAITLESHTELRYALGALARASSIDTAAQVFADEIESLPRNRRFRVRFEANLAEPAAIGNASVPRWLFVLVPGWLYRSDPGTGANLAPVRAVLGSLGPASRLVALDENGTIDENAITLAREIEQLERAGRSLVLVSTSKGGPETYLALDRLRATGRAKDIAAWVNIGGLLLETAVGRARWWVRAGGWREATTRQAHACKEERQSQAPVRTCQRARSALTQSVTPAKARARAFSRRSARQAAVNCGF